MSTTAKSANATTLAYLQARGEAPRVGDPALRRNAYGRPAEARIASVRVAKARANEYDQTPRIIVTLEGEAGREYTGRAYRVFDFAWRLESKEGYSVTPFDASVLQAIADDTERRNLRTRCEGHLREATLEQLRAVYAILNPSTVEAVEPPSYVDALAAMA